MQAENRMRPSSDTYRSGIQNIAAKGRLDWTLESWFLSACSPCWLRAGTSETRAAIARQDALSRERIAAIEKGVPLPERPLEHPKPPERAGHPLKPTLLATLAVGIALLVGLAPSHRVWGMVVTALGIAGVCHWLVVGRNEWQRQRIMEEEMHRAYVDYLKALATSAASDDGADA